MGEAAGLILSLSAAAVNPTPRDAAATAFNKSRLPTSAISDFYLEKF